ncbi:MAG TPA: SpoIIE family protein phosphatase [Polyangiaceae bacterium]
MNLVQNLLALYAGILLITALLTALLWRRSRDPLHRALFFVWASTIVSFVLQGALAQNDLLVTVGFSSAFLVNLALAQLVAEVVGTSVRWRPFAAGLVVALTASAALFAAHGSFLAVSAPVCVAVAMPLLVTGMRIVRTRWRALTTIDRALLASCGVFCLHNLDFALLRDKPNAAPAGFTIAILIITALAITSLAAVLEAATEKQARIHAEMEAARRIQMRLLPRDVALPGLELACHMRPADAVGGDYFDIHALDDASWLLVGDVTGHGLGAGLVMLMAQSIIGSILQARPDVKPHELNFLANRVLSANLARLGEQRHMTLVSLCRVGDGGRFLVSGSHDNIYVYRAKNRDVEVVPVAHFPLGIGILADLRAGDFGHGSLTLVPGDLLFVGTDGITEAARGGDPAKGLFGEDGLVAHLRESGARPLSEVKSALVQKLDAFTGGAYDDDVAFIMVRAKGETA